MHTSSRFNLEKAITAWRRAYEQNRVFSAEDVEELERHLRDHTADLVRRGRTEEEAFAEALQRVGDYGSTEAEYRKLFWEKRQHRRTTLHEIGWRLSMLRNHLTIALRNLKRRPGYTLINVFGLAVGMACCLLIGLYIEDELSYDRFHENADRLLIMAFDNGWGEGTATPYPLATMLERDFPEVQHAIRTDWAMAFPVTREDTRLESERRVLAADSSFFLVFTYPFIIGDPGTALSTPDAAVISESTAETYFAGENPIGKTLVLKRWGETTAFTVRGVIEDAPGNSTLNFDMVIPLSTTDPENDLSAEWSASMYQTYILLRENVDLDALNAKIAAAIEPHYEHGEPPLAKAIPLTSYYLSGLHQTGDFKGQWRYIYIFGSIAVFVLLIAVVNYVNLVTAQATQRAKEVGVRKTLGAGRMELARQFQMETALLSLTALVIALLFTAIALPGFNALFEKELSFDFQEHGVALAGLSGCVLLVSALAGSYPAFVLTRFHPAQVLRGAGAIATPGSAGIVRKGLVVLQFTVTVALIIGTTVVYSQLRYIQNKNLGFDGEQVVAVNLPWGASGQVYGSIKQAAQAHSGIVSATIAMGTPGQFNIRLGRETEHISPEAQTEKKDFTFAPAKVDYDYLRTLGIKLIAGRDFSPDFPSDETRAFILNRTAVEQLGWTPDEAIGKSFRTNGGNTPFGEIIGVVEDFHIASLKETMEPVLLQIYDDQSWSTGHLLLARLSPDDIQGGMAHLEQVMARFVPDEPFTYEFLDDKFDAMYRSEVQLSYIFTAFAALAIFIACLGLFGLAAYTAEQRTKEIGIRKALGASASNIVALLSKDFLKLVAIGFVLAAPLAYFAMSRWLEDFAYRIEIGPGIFILAGALAITIALATVSYQSIKAALADPVKTLRYE